jgi:CRP-like cAMP-binding protein
MEGRDRGLATSPELRDRLEQRLTAVLSACKAATIRALITSARVRVVSPGGSVYAQGEPVPLTLILGGYGIAQRTTTDGQQIFSGVAPAGQLFGYSGIGGSVSSVELLALTQCEVAQWDGHDVRNLAEQDNALALVAIDSMAASLHALMGQIEGFLHQDARRRVLRILSRHRALFFGDAPVLNRTHLPGLVGTTREMTGRVLRQLEEEGTLRREGRTGLRLLDPDRLEAPAA